MDHIIIPDDEALIVDEIEDEVEIIQAEVEKIAALENEGMLAQRAEAWSIDHADLQWQLDRLYDFGRILLVLVVLTFFTWRWCFSTLNDICTHDEFGEPAPRHSPLQKGVSSKKVMRGRRSRSGRGTVRHAVKPKVDSALHKKTA
jgi:hypothetical protein